MNWQDQLTPGGDTMYAANTVDFLSKFEQRDYYGLPIIKSEINKDSPSIRPPIVAVDAYDPSTVE